MSGSAKKRREKERQRTRRAVRDIERRQRADEAFERFYPGGVAEFHALMDYRHEGATSSGHVTLDGRTYPTEVLPMSRPV